LAHLKEKLNGKKQISYGELEIWLKERIQIPVDEHEVYVLGYEVVIDAGKPEQSYFRLSIGTIYLLRIALKSNHVVTDSTHCMIWNVFPVFLTGPTDLSRQLKILHSFLIH
jgi:hypothetical protein